MTVDEAIEWYGEGLVALSRLDKDRHEIVLKALKFYKDLGPGGKLLDVRGLMNHQCKASNDEQFVCWLKAGIREYTDLARRSPDGFRQRPFAIAEAYEQCLSFLGIKEEPNSDQWPCEWNGYW